LAEGILKIISDETLALKLRENGRKKVVMDRYCEKNDKVV
jgi:hypothetical protein